MPILVSTNSCVLCGGLNAHTKYTHYTRKDGTTVHRYACKDCVRAKMKAYRQPKTVQREHTRYTIEVEKEAVPTP